MISWDRISLLHFCRSFLITLNGKTLGTQGAPSVPREGTALYQFVRIAVSTLGCGGCHADKMKCALRLRGTGWTVRSSDLGSGKIIFSTPKCPAEFGGPRSLPFNGYRVKLQGETRPRVKVTHSSPSSVEITCECSFYMPSWCGHSQFYTCYLTTLVSFVLLLRIQGINLGNVKGWRLAAKLRHCVKLC